MADYDSRSMTDEVVESGTIKSEVAPILSAAGGGYLAAAIAGAAAGPAIGVAAIAGALYFVGKHTLAKDS